MIGLTSRDRGIRERLAARNGGSHGRAAACVAALVMIFFAGCGSPPIGADRVGPHGSREQVEGSAVNSGELSANSLSLLHRHDLDRRAVSEPEAILPEVFKLAASTRERDLLFVLAELSYYAGERLRKKAGAEESGHIRDLDLGAAVYAYLFLFGEAEGDFPDGFDRRFRTACEIYNYGLGMALASSGDENAVARLENGRRQLPVGSIDLRVDTSAFPASPGSIEQYLVADQFRVRGLGIRNREAGLGTPLIAVGVADVGLRLKRSQPATVFLRVEGGLADLSAGGARGTLELHAAFGETSVMIGKRRVPLEIDLTVAQAHTLNQDEAWRVEKALFFRPDDGQQSQIIPAEPYQRGRIPVVLVHGTYSSPVWWAEMVNMLNADPVLRERLQIWTFLYGSGRPIGVSARELRAALTKKVNELDPEGHDLLLRQMVVIGHSQGGLLARLVATETGDTLWQVLEKEAAHRLPTDPKQREVVRDHATFTPLPFVRRVIFICTPHRGSYLVGGVVRDLGRWLISIPKTAAEWTGGVVLPPGDGRPPGNSMRLRRTSLDGMSPDDPLLLALAEIPVAPGIKAHSIIAVKGDGNVADGRDGVVAYASAHLEGVESEYIVRAGHSCQSMPPTIEEVRRILHEHIDGVAATVPGPGDGQESSNSD